MNYKEINKLKNSEVMNNISLKAAIKAWISAHKLPIIISLVVLLAAGVVITEKLLTITENPDFCGKNCHIMRPYYDSWSISAHKDIACINCHYEPGLIGHIKGKINGLMQMYSYETSSGDTSDPLFAKVLDKNCLICHETRIYSPNINFNGVNFSHSNHPVSVTCTNCHSDVKHPANITAICDKCHANAHPKNWLSTHNTQVSFAGKACTDCHQEKYCTDCHASRNASNMNLTPLSYG
ncbi:MAG: cytochrome c3 family protein [Candidatus Methanoperedens sp.]|nr:cytochrome c3 family protein [Candidatus Methanoperedens sp.]MCZ7404026.1 cytochrome c3 family protein [Candidatus Methanoperedens sp.]